MLYLIYSRVNRAREPFNRIRECLTHNRPTGEIFGVGFLVSVLLGYQFTDIVLFFRLDRFKNSMLQ